MTKPYEGHAERPNYSKGDEVEWGLLTLSDGTLRLEWMWTELLDGDTPLKEFQRFWEQAARPVAFDHLITTRRPNE